MNRRISAGWTAYADVWSSADGVSWTRATDNAAFGPRQRHTTVVFGGKLWVMGGEDQWHARSLSFIA